MTNPKNVRAPGSLFQPYFQRRDYDEIQAYVRKRLASDTSEGLGQHKGARTT